VFEGATVADPAAPALGSPSCRRPVGAATDCALAGRTRPGQDTRMEPGPVMRGPAARNLTKPDWTGRDSGPLSHVAAVGRTWLPGRRDTGEIWGRLA